MPRTPPASLFPPFLWASQPRHRVVRALLFSMESARSFLPGLTVMVTHGASGPKEVEGLTNVGQGSDKDPRHEFEGQIAAGATHVVAIVSHDTAAEYDIDFEETHHD